VWPWKEKHDPPWQRRLQRVPESEYAERKREEPVVPYHVIHQQDADIDGYKKVFLAYPVGPTNAGVEITAERDGVVHTLILHGQREFDVPAGSTVTFPDGSTLNLG